MLRWISEKIGFSPSTYISDLSSDSDSSVDMHVDKEILYSDVVVEPVSEETTDASLNVFNFPQAEAVLHLEELAAIEQYLDPHEIVSLVYMLYNNPHTALQELQLWLAGDSNKNLLSSWAGYENSKGNRWQPKVIEALCIIQNYAVLKKLGYSKNALIGQFLPRNELVSQHVAKIKKAVYLVCDNLDNSESQTFLKHVKCSSKVKNIFQEFPYPYLEIYFLHWETIGYITHEEMSNITSILKFLDLELVYDILNNVLPSNHAAVTGTKTDLQDYERNIGKSKQPIPVKARKQSTSTDTHIHTENIGVSITRSALEPIKKCKSNLIIEDDRYDVDPANPGIVLIINQEDFYTETDQTLAHLLPDTTYQLESRKGTEKDKEKLEEVFKLYGFKVIITTNLTHEQMISEIKNVTASIKNESSLFICILSHGDKGIVYGVNSCQVEVTEIQNIMCKVNKHLKGKPKVLILQSCQGTKCQRICESDEEEENIATDGPTLATKHVVPDTSDMFTFWATIPGYAAIRNEKTGSWFIQSFCKNLLEGGQKYHFEDICTRTIGEVTTKIWKVKTWKEQHKNAMTPIKASTFRFLLYFPPLKECISNDFMDKCWL